MTSHRASIVTVALFLGIAGLAVSGQAWAQAGLVAAYAFNEGAGSTVADASGKNNLGTITGATWTTAGRNGGALVFNGTTARVTVPDAASLRLTTAMTLAAWVYPTAAPTGWRAIIAKNTDGYYLMASTDQANRPGVGGTWTTGNQNTFGTSTLAVNTWTHLAATFDGATVRLYVNGALVASQAQTASLAPTTGTLQIGADAYAGENFAGRIDDVRVYNRALALSEVQTDMNTAVGGSPAPDTTVPTIALTSPTAGTTYTTGASPLTVAGTAADNVAVTQVTWSNDRGGSGTAAGTTSWSAAGIALQSGANVLTLTARDAAANTGSKTLTVTYDPTAPTVSITSPTTATTYTTSTSPVTLAGTAADNIAVTQVTWSSGRGGSGTATGTTSWSAAGIALQSGANVLTVTTRDAAGNAATATLTVTYTAPDTTLPTVAITTPTSAATYATNVTPLALTGTAGDNVGVTQVTWSSDRGGSGTAAGTTSWTVNGIVLQSGANVLTVTARDAASNTANKTLTVTYDPAPPTVSLSAPASGATLSGFTTLTATAADNIGVLGVQFLLDGAPLGAEQTGPYSFTWNTLGTSNGSHTLSARARDAAGNTTLAANLPVTVANAQLTGLVAAYAFNEGAGSTVADASGNNNLGTITGATWTTAGRNGGALVFNGTTARVTVPDAASLRLTTAMTLAAWVYPTAAPTGWRAIIAKNTDGYYLMASTDQANRPGVGGTWTTGNQNTFGTSTLAVNTWTHLAATFDGATVRLYVNGALVASQAQTASLAPTTGTLQIGADAYAGENFAGRIDDVRVYNRALALSEVQTDMNTAVGGSPAPDTTVPTIALTSPTAGTTYTTGASPLTVAGTAADNVAVTQVTWSNDRGGSGTAAGTTSWSAAGIALQSGANVLTLTARDAAANTGSKTLTVTYDPTAPTVSITSPTTATTYTTSTSPVTLAGTAADNIAVTQVTWSSGRGGSGTATGTTSWSAAGIALQSGANVLTVTTRDAAGNAATATLTVTYTAPDTTLPTVAITTPTSAATYATNVTPLALTGTAGDNVGVTQVTWSSDRGGSGTAAGTTSWTVNGIVLQSGANVLTVTARDAASNTANKTLTVTYDPAPPTVSLSAPASGATLSGFTTLTATAADNIGVLGVQFLLDGAPLGAEQTGPYSFTWNTLGTSNGSHTLSARARDAAGNTTLAANLPVTVANAQLTGLVAAYAFNEGAGSTVADASGNNNLGTITGATWTTAGRNGGALVFNGTTARVTVPDAASLRLTTAMTLAAWVYPTAAPTGWRAIIAKNTDGYYLMASTDQANRPGVGGTWTTGNQNTFGTSTLAVNTWTHLAATFDGATVRLYVNGALVASQAQTASLAPTTGTLQIGADAYAGENFAGRIDDVRVYNRALALSEVQTDMNTAVGGSPAPDTTVPTIALTSPTAGTTYTTGASPLTVAGTAADNVAVTQVTWSNDRGGSGTAAGTTSWSAAGIALQSGANVLTLTARDAAANTASTTLTVTYTPESDTTAPTVTITAPAGGMTVSGTVPVTANASDNVGVVGVKFLVDGAPVGAEDMTAPYSLEWGTTSVANGSHTVTAQARDAAGNTTVSAGVSVTVTNTGIPLGAWSGPFDWSPLVAVHMTLTPTGDVLIWDGQDLAPLSAHLWDPDTGTFLAVPNSSNIFCSGHCVLPDGRVFIAGGHVNSYVGIRDVNLFNPTTNTWAAGPPMSFARWYPTTTVLGNGRVLVVSGSVDCMTCIVEIPEIFDPATNTWQQLSSASLALDLYPHMFVLPDGRVLASANSEAPMISQVLDINAQTWTPVGSTTALNGGSSVMYRPGLVMKSGLGRNVDFSSAPAVKTTYVLDMTQPSPTWRQTVDMAFARTQHNLTILPDGTVLATGGGGVSDVFNTGAAVLAAELWSPTTETWTTLASMQVPRLYHSTALLLPDGRVLAAGGGRFGINQPSAEIYSPPYLFKGQRPTITSVPTQVAYGASFTVQTPNAAAITSVSLIRIGSVTHAINMDQRFLNLSFQAGSGTLTVQAPANGNLAPPGYYMLFILDGNGVPSVAPIIRVH